MLNAYGIFEIVDFIKDIVYAFIYPHPNLYILIMIWVSALFNVVYCFLKVAFMSLD